MSGHYAPVRDSDAEEDAVGHGTPGFPQAEPYRGSTETLVPEATTPPGAQYARVPPDQAGNGRAHMRPAVVQQTSAGAGPYSDPWSPGYQRNKGRFSLGNTQELHAADQSKRTSRLGLGLNHPRHASSAPPGPPLTKWQNFKRKFQGHRLRERGHKVPGLWASLKAIVTCSWLNILFVFLPLAWVWGWMVAQPFVKEKKKVPYENYVYLFILAFIAIIPLENICEFAGEQLALYCGESIGDLIIITLHNVVEVVLAWFLLIKCELKLLQATIVGVVLLHALLVPGIAFLTGGSKIWAQNLKPRVTELNQSLLTIGVLALVVPAGFYSALPYRHPLEYAPQFANETLVEEAKAALNQTAANVTEHAARLLARAGGEEIHKSSVHAMEIAAQTVAVSDQTRGMILSLSRGISVVLFVIYVGSRIYLHNPPGGKKRATASQFEEVEAMPVHDAGYAMTPGQTYGSGPYFDQKHRSTTPPQVYSSSTNLMYREEDREKATALLEREQGDASHAAGGHGNGHGHHHAPEVGPWPALVLLLISVFCVTVTAECLVVAIKPIREQVDEKRLFTDEWFGLILLPLLSYAGDGLNAVMYFIRTSLFSQNVAPPEDFAKAKSIDLAIQFALLWVPLLVLVAWIVNTPLTLLFDHFEIVVIVGASFLVNSVTQDGRTNWSEGLIMVGFYVIIALAAWFYPGDADVHFLSYCKSVEELLSNSPYKAAA
ncbi:hypothetical protein FRC11_008053 [Ceratobasidium sp. 423]|nr:hypothetical protein FRC11_008053 [Ceratobasidium sp. 423]